MTATLDDVTKKKVKAGPSAQEQVAEELVRRAREQGLSLTGPDGLLKQLTKTVLETALNQEMTEHLGHEKHSPAANETGNVRNGIRPKTVLTGDFAAVVVDAEVVAGVALLDAVLAGAVAGQRPGEGDPVLAPGPLHVHQGGVAAVHQVLAGEQAPTL